MYVRLMLWMALVTLYTLAVTLLTENVWLPKWEWGDDMATVLGLALKTAAFPQELRCHLSGTIDAFVRETLG